VVRHKLLLKLLADEEAKDRPPLAERRIDPPQARHGSARFPPSGAVFRSCHTRYGSLSQGASKRLEDVPYPAVIVLTFRFLDAAVVQCLGLSWRPDLLSENERTR
jgi:hypothetical protein